MPISLEMEIPPKGYKQFRKHRHLQGSFLCFFAIAVMVSTAFGLDNNPTNQEAVLLWEKDFGEEVVDVIFGEAEMTIEEARALGYKGWEQRKATDIVKVQYPKVMVTKKSVKFLDKKGKIKNKIALKENIIEIEGVWSKKSTWESAVISKNEETIGIVEHGYEWINRVTFLNSKGQELFELTGIDGVPHISPDGKLIVGFSKWEHGQSKPKLIFYSQNGTLLKTHEGFPWYVGFSNDSQCVFSILDLKTQFVISGMIEPKACLFNQAGEKLWEKDVKAGYGVLEVLIITRDQKYYLILTGRKIKDTQDIIIAYDENGKIIWEEKVNLITLLSENYSSFEEFACFYKKEGIVEVRSAQSGEVVWSYDAEDLKRELKSPGIMARSLAISPDGSTVAIIITGFMGDTRDFSLEAIDSCLLIVKRNKILQKVLLKDEFLDKISMLSNNSVFVSGKKGGYIYEF